MIGFVLGNGRSRLKINPENLRSYGKIYGCNALYREFSPDYLVAVDPKMINEINSAKYQHEHSVWTNFHPLYKNFTGFNYFQPSTGYSSGPSAVRLAIAHKNTQIYMLGFDYTGINDCFNNVYADTKNYKKSTDVATYSGNWQNQTETIIKTNPNIKFYRVVDQEYYPLAICTNNFKHMQYNEFLQHFNKNQ